jgi:SAM-dependent methyltransferase
MDWELGCRLPEEQWIWLNRDGVFEDESLRRYVAPFPPLPLMTSVSGVMSERDFAAHGAHFFAALTKAAGCKLSDFPTLLDFGCGVGRLMRMLKGHPGSLHGCDIDPRHVAWMSSAIDFCETGQSRVHPPLPYEKAMFDAVICISVFSHLNESSQFEFLAELARITKPGATLMLTIHGDCALRRAQTEERIFDMISVSRTALDEAARKHAEGRYAFTLQHGHLTRLAGDANSHSILPDEYEYGITFIPKCYLRDQWSRFFKVKDIVDGGLHDFQDIVVLERHGSEATLGLSPPST